MKNIREWINNPNRDYKEGVKIYHRNKLNTKHDNFFNTQSPSEIHSNMLFGKIKRIYSKMILKSENHKEVAKAEPIKIQKIQPVKVKKQTKTESKDKTPTNPPVVELRKNKKYVNKLLALNWPDLSHNDKLVFFNSEKYFLEKKTLMLENGDIEKKLRSLHTKMKEIDPDSKFDTDRKKIMDELGELDDKKSKNWIVIDTWKEIQVDDTKETETEKAARIAIENTKRVAANNIYIYRALKTIPTMPKETEKQRNKIKKKEVEVENRKKELEELGHPYKEKK